jgi:HKD family nuclease
MHAEYNVKFSNAQQAKSAYNYRNTKEKLHKTIAFIWFNKIWK